MRIALLLVLLTVVLAPEARAQPPYGTPGSFGDRLQRGLEDNAMGLGGGIVAIASGYATIGLTDLIGTSSDVQVVSVYVVGAAGFALGVHAGAQLTGVDGTLANAFGDAMSGVAIGAPLGITTALLLGAALPEDPPCGGLICLDSRAFAAAFAGLVVAVGVPTMWVLLDYRNEGSLIRLGASGTSGPGLALTVGL